MRPVIGGQLSVCGWFMGLRGILFSLVLAPIFAAAPLAAQTPEQKPFDEWLVELRSDALKAGISEKTLDAALADVAPDAAVVKADRNQPEVKLTAESYLGSRISPQRIAKGREMMEKYRTELRQVADAFGVQPRFIVAIWGLETNYGGFTGGRYVIQSLVTLAYDPRRSDFFRKELLAALRILDEGHVEVPQMTGSWAGAMGQPQFMPTSFNAYAVDFDGDGRRDIWTTPVDVFASIARYLKSFGWNAEYTWGREVKIDSEARKRIADRNLDAPAKSCALRNHRGPLSLKAWQDLGVTRLNGDPLPDVEIEASLAMPDGPEGRAFLTYNNYRAILRYNCSDLYAISIGILADAFKDLE